MFAIQRIFSKSSIARAAIAALVAVTMVNISASPANAAGTESRLTNLSKVERSTVNDFDKVIHSSSGMRMVAVGRYQDPAISTDGGYSWISTQGVSREWDLLAGSANLGVSLATEVLARDDSWNPTAGEIYVATSFGGDFTKVTPSPNPGYWSAVAVSSSGNQMFAASGNKLFWSTTAGSSWSSFTLVGSVEAQDTFRVLSIVVSAEGANDLADEILLGMSSGEIQHIEGFSTDSPVKLASAQALTSSPVQIYANDINHLEAKLDGSSFSKVFAASSTGSGLKLIQVVSGELSTITNEGFDGTIQGVQFVNNTNLFVVSEESSHLITNAGESSRSISQLNNIPNQSWKVVSASNVLGATNGSVFLQNYVGESYLSATGIVDVDLDTRIPKFGINKIQNTNHGIYALTDRGGVLKKDSANWLPDSTLATEGFYANHIGVSENGQFLAAASWGGNTALISSTQSIVRQGPAYDSGIATWDEPKFIGIADDGQTMVVVGTVTVNEEMYDKIWISVDAGSTFEVISNRPGVSFRDMHFDGSSQNLYVTSSEYGLEKFSENDSQEWLTVTLAAPITRLNDQFTVSPGEQQIIAGQRRGPAFYITEGGPQEITALGSHLWTDFEIGTVGLNTWTVATSNDGQIQFKLGAGEWDTVLAGAEVTDISLGATLAFVARETVTSDSNDLYLASSGWSLETVAGAFYPDNVWDSSKFKFGLFDDDNEINNLSHFTRVDGYTNESSQYLCQTLGVAPCTEEQLAGLETNLQGKLTLPTCEFATQTMCLQGVHIYESGEVRTAATLDPSFDVGTPTFAAQPEYGLPAGGKTSVWTSDWQHNGSTGGQENDGSQYAVNATVTFHWNKESKKVYFSTMVASVTPFNDLQSPGYEPNRVEQFDRDGIPTVGYSMTVDPGRCVIVKTDYCGRIQDFAENTQVELSVRVPNEIGGWYKGRMVDPAISTSVFDGAPGNQVITVSAEHAFVPRLQVDMDADLFTQTLLDRNQEDTAYGLNASNGGGIGIAASNEWSVNVIKALLQSPEVIPNKANGFNTVWSFGTLSSDIAIDTCAATAGTSVLGIIATDAMAYSDRGPILNPTSGTLDYQVAGAHFKADGTTVVQGNYQMTLNLALAKCQWGLTDAELSPTALTNAVSVVDANGTPKTGVTTSVAIDENWLTFKASGFTFSEPKIKVQLKPATVNSSGDSTPVATPTPTPSVTPTPAAEAKPAPLKVPASMKLGTTTKVAIPAAAKAIAGVKVTVRQSAATKKICVATPVISGGKVVAVKIKALKKSLVGCAFMLNTTVPDSNTKFESSSERYVVPIK